MPSHADDLAVAPGDHVVHLYDSDDELVEMVGDHLAAGLLRGDAAVVITTAEHGRLLRQHLAAAGVDVEAAQGCQQLVVLDATTTLQQIQGPHGFDPGVFDAVIGGLVREVGAGRRGVRAFGEMVALLWQAGDVVGAIELEKRWNSLQGTLGFSLVCGYPTWTVNGDADREDLRRVCQLHSAVVSAGPVDDALGDTGPRHEAEHHFPVGVDSPTHARRFVVARLRQWGFDAVDDAALVVTELATNAVLHARSAFTVRLRAIGRTVRITVEDSSTSAPHVVDRGLLALSGRGMELVDALSADWSARVTSSGKLVWAELRT